MAAAGPAVLAAYTGHNLLNHIINMQGTTTVVGFRCHHSQIQRRGLLPLHQSTQLLPASCWAGPRQKFKRCLISEASWPTFTLSAKHGSS